MEQITNRSLLTILCEPGEDTLAISNPATGEVIGHIRKQSEADILAAIERAAAAQKTWARRPAKERGQILYRWYQLLMDNQDDLGRLMTLEQGKPVAEAKGEVAYGAAYIQWFAEEAKRSYGESIPGPSADKRIVTIKQPVGVVAAITPWNFPIAMITRKAAPALAAGCSFIGKPADLTPLSAYAVAELGYQAGLPRELLQMITGTRSSLVGKLFCDSPLIRKLSFTGSTQVGRLLLGQCADTVKRTSMELGGNAPFIVFDDADIDQAVDGAIASKFRNAGQTCVCANRFYVHDAVYDDFVAKFSAKVAALKVGNGLEAGVNIGPVINQAAKDEITGLIQRTVEQGARVVTGNQPLEGLYMQPTVLADVEHTMDIVQEEIFGPVAPVIRFDSDQALINMANDTIFGLAAYFYSRDISRIWQVAEALEYGMVGINEGIISNEAAPFGGVKQSGIGREGSRYGIEDYLEIKYLCFGGLHSS